jgi:BirA family biotin operon repressor/biotin-[acetyl-CoA-carboxylase] ligase
MRPENPLDPDCIRDGAAHPPIGHKVLVFRETGSTNDVVHRLAQASEPEGTVVFAESQSAGRGQFGREWDSRAGLGLWFSILLRPQWPAHQITQITPMVAVSVADTVIASAGIAVVIKPPNDIYFEGRKLGGILTEARTGSNPYAVVGIGINVNHSAADFPDSLAARATSLAQIVGWAIDREVLAAQLLSNLGSIYSSTAAPSPEVLNRYENLSQRWGCATFLP